MELDLAGEDVECACDEPNGSVGVAARTAAAHLLEPALELRVGTLQAGEPFEPAGDRIESVHTRTTLPRALARAR
jgi:hypothetical protein